MKNSTHTISGVVDDYIAGHFAIGTCGNESVERDSYPQHPVHGVIFMLIFSGSAIVCIHEKEYPVKAGMLVSVVPFQSCFFTKQTDNFRYERILFELDFMADFPLVLHPFITEKMEKLPCIEMEKETFNVLKGYYNNILYQYNRTGHPSRMGIIKAHLYILMAEISGIYSHKTIHTKTTRKEQIATDFFSLLHSFFRKERKPQFYAQSLNLSAKHLSTLLKEITGKTLYAWICDFVIKESKIMLCTKDLSISQISEELNFPNSSYFARYFRKYTGQSPTEYRDRQMK